MANDGTAVIGKAITIRGEIEGSQDLRVDGVVEGQVRLQARLLVGKGGLVKGEVQASILEIEGRFDGTASCDELALLKPGCDSVGTIASPRVVVEEGALFTGTLDMDVGPEPVLGEVRSHG
jgi:cytoskeletal protein CcmA (bactofilin family)